MPFGKRIVAKLVLLGLLLAAGLAGRFRYYDNGKWVKTSISSIYLREIRGFGRLAEPARRLPPNWGSLSGYAARNSTLDLVNLKYSEPLEWEDIAAGPGIIVFVHGSGGDRLPVAIYPNWKVDGLNAQVIVSALPPKNDSAVERNEPIIPRYRLVLSRLPLTSTLYVTSVTPLPQGTP